MVLTDEMINAGRSERGGWNRDQLALLGVAWPPRTGWKKFVVGDKISDKDYYQFLRLRG